MDQNDTLQEAQPKKYPKACQILWACNKICRPIILNIVLVFKKQQKGCIFVMRIITTQNMNQYENLSQ